MPQQSSAWVAHTTAGMQRFLWHAKAVLQGYEQHGGSVTVTPGSGLCRPATCVSMPLIVRPVTCVSMPLIVRPVTCVSMPLIVQASHLCIHATYCDASDLCMHVTYCAGQSLVYPYQQFHMMNAQDCGLPCHLLPQPLLQCVPTPMFLWPGT